ncbi:hypothetical protein F4604DRAFT_71735 [Suillus subluteus]|nr:hypothetical protein F4604DRAFT_71735 [Suillus subluteus]
MARICPVYVCVFRRFSHCPTRYLCDEYWSNLRSHVGRWLACLWETCQVVLTCNSSCIAGSTISARVGVLIALWDSIIATYGDLSKVDTIPWCIGPTIELTALITFLVQSFFAYRIYRLQNKKLAVAIPIVALSFTRLIMASITNSEMLKLKSYDTFFQRFSWVFTIGLLLSVLVDIMITTFLCYFLRKNRPKFTDTVRIIDTLTFWTIQNGLMTSAAATATLLCWKIMPSNRIFLGLHFVVAKLYANSLLATLNARKEILNGKQYTPTNNQPMSIVFREHGPDSSITQQGSVSIMARHGRMIYYILHNHSCEWTLPNRKQCTNGGHWCVTLLRILNTTFLTVTDAIEC